MSYTLKSRSRTPKGGWAFRQPEANWEMPLPLAQTFESATRLIRQMRINNRKLNLPTDAGSVARDLEQFTLARLNFDPEWCVPGQDEVKKKPVSPPGPEKSPSLWQRARAGAAALVGEVKKTAAGARILGDWLGAGMEPVASSLAESRAAICLECPKNVRGNWRTMVTGAVAEAVKEQAEMKGRIELATPQDHELGTCGVCLCHLPLKVWVPLSHIAEHTSEQVWSELPEWCWMRKESGR